MDTITFLQRVIESKAHGRQRLADLSVPEKVYLLVQMQQRRAPIARSRGEDPIVWELDEVEREIGEKQLAFAE